jgi:hypothetical protein
MPLWIVRAPFSGVLPGKERESSLSFMAHMVAKEWLLKTNRHGRRAHKKLLRVFWSEWTRERVEAISLSGTRRASSLMGFFLFAYTISNPPRQGQGMGKSW